ncbi:sugar ABC transporter substrate-binding protein [Youxingia wuxianensis]|uniref:Sugar ABC transporter substrate-binding protein n=1 Tax=Youxingia wuxianensis TaxID=2763678 RepID=A0A926ELD3_9FIRM|nr:sugar ABC transporter substrate-binding protein [Youxingia wuxianensis]MBC8584510.1 sugar ABC transporter substrate-binding protein [Youxingia wuxianensis]
MKKVVALILSALMILTCVAGCASSTDSSTPAPSSSADQPASDASSEAPADGEKEVVRIGMSANNIGIDDYQTKCDELLREYASTLEGVELTVLDAAGDVNTQISQIQDFIQQDMDAIIVWATDSVSVIPGLQQAQEAGVPIMCTNNPIDPSGEEYLTAFVGPDHYQEAVMCAEMLADMFPDGANVVQLTGTPGYDVSTWRQDGFEASIPENITILETQNADWNREKAQQQMEKLILKYGDQIDALYAADDNIAIGAYNALKAANMDIPIIACAFIGNEEGVKCMEDGIIDACVLQSPFPEAPAVMDTAVKIAKGEEVEFLTRYDLYPVTSENVRQVITDNGFEVWK